MYTIETTIKGGLPVFIEFSHDPADPSVGVMSDTWNYENAYWVRKGRVGNTQGKQLPHHLQDQITEEEVTIAEMKLGSELRDMAEW